VSANALSLLKCFAERKVLKAKLATIIYNTLQGFKLAGSFFERDYLRQFDKIDMNYKKTIALHNSS